MSVEIIPAIIAKSFDELKEKIETVEPYVKWVQLDIMDGKFVPNTTWNEPEDLKLWKPKVLLEAHLMISEPEKYAEQWIDAGIKRIIFHIEATSDPYAIIKICRERKVEVGVAINPETPESALSLAAGQALLVSSVDMVLVLGVTPGFGGQEFMPSVLEKIKALRNTNPNLTIEVDGGMNPKTAKKVVEAGASVVVVGSYIFRSDDIKKAIDELKNAWQS
ncbi:MAG: ribulose-phosphate 3-epimerase [Candidatus Spechtbacterales bacterium]